MKKDVPRKAREFLKLLSRRLPIAHPYRLYISRALTEEGVGEAELKIVRGANLFIIRLRPGMEWKEARETLIHEWAHCRAWAATQALSFDHDAHWGIEYATTYREAGEISDDDVTLLAKKGQ